MVYVENWDEFLCAAEQLYQKHPQRTRYMFKYRHSEGRLVVKVTDDYVCLMYRTDQQQDLKRVEKLNWTLMSRMMNKLQTAASNSITAVPASPAPIYALDAPSSSSSAASADKQKEVAAQSQAASGVNASGSAQSQNSQNTKPQQQQQQQQQSGSSAAKKKNKNKKK